MKKIILAAMLAAITAVSAVSMTACGGGEPSQPADSVVSVQPVADQNLNNLTGETDLTDEAVGKRPVAVMINNIESSLPQYGISSADLMFETLVEGGITRMMAVYGDYTQVPNVCSIRSCRYYYPILAEGLDALYIHCGADMTIAMDTLNRLGTDRFDGNAGNTLLFERDQDRLQSYSVEHTMMLKGANVPQAMANANMRTDLDSGKNVPLFDFNTEGVLVQPENGANPCTRVDFQYSGYYYSTFRYDTTDKTYYKRHNGSPHMDITTGEQLNYTNVFVLETDISVRDEKKGLMDVDWTGGTGYYISGGASQQIKWSKPNESASIQITDLNGRPIKVNTGKSYFGIINYGDATLSVEESY